MEQHREPKPLVEGLGGAFVFSEDVPRLVKWYEERLGIDFEGDRVNAAYAQFFARDDSDTERRLDTTFSILAAQRPLPEVDREDWDESQMYGDQPFMVNLRVGDLDVVLERLRHHGTRILGTQDEPYGRFAWIYDADDNRVELYESRMAAWMEQNEEDPA
jgi:predicted enzyme related to lactoylglutathione lyase